MERDIVYNALVRVTKPNRRVYMDYPLVEPSKTFKTNFMGQLGVCNPYFIWDKLSQSMIPYAKPNCSSIIPSVEYAKSVYPNSVIADLVIIRGTHINEIYYFVDNVQELKNRLHLNKGSLTKHFGVLKRWVIEPLKFFPRIDAQLNSKEMNKRIKYIDKNILKEEKTVNSFTTAVWNKLHNETYDNCDICGDPISIWYFHKAHIKSKYMFGSNDIENILPTCETCNLTMGTQNYVNYKKSVEKGDAHISTAIHNRVLTKIHNEQRKTEIMLERAKTWEETKIKENVGFWEYNALIQIHEDRVKDKSTCKATLKSGKRCNKKTKYYGYCGTHRKKSKKSAKLKKTSICTAKLGNGKACTNTIKEKGYCGVHIHKMACKALLKSNKRCTHTGKFNGYCGIHRK